MLLNVMERLIFHEWDAMLLTMLNKMRTGVDEIANFGGLHVRHTIADDDAVILFSREFAHDARLAHAAIIAAKFIASMRPCDLDAVAAEVAAVAIDVVVRNFVRLQDRINKKVDATASYIKFKLLIPAKFEKCRESVANPCLPDCIVSNFFSLGRWQ